IHWPPTRGVFPAQPVECKMFRSARESISVRGHTRNSELVSRRHDPPADPTTGGCMSRHQRRFDDVDFDLGGRSRSGGVSAIVLATALGVGIGMLAAPDTGVETHRR